MSGRGRYRAISDSRLWQLKTQMWNLIVKHKSKGRGVENVFFMTIFQRFIKQCIAMRVRLVLTTQSFVFRLNQMQWIQLFRSNKSFMNFKRSYINQFKLFWDIFVWIYVERQNIARLGAQDCKIAHWRWFHFSLNSKVGFRVKYSNVESWTQIVDPPC